MRIRSLLAAGAAALSTLAAANAAVVHVNDENGVLGTVDTDTGVATVIGAIGVVLTDIAFAPDGTLYGISFDSVYVIDANTAAATLIGLHGIPSANALVFGSDGTLYAAGIDTNGTDLYTVDTGTGAATSLGALGVNSGGDLAFVGADLYLSTGDDRLVQIDLSGPAASDIGGFGVANVFGIASPGDGTLFGVAGTDIFEVDLGTGMISNLMDFSGQGLGDAFGQSFFSEAAPVPLPGAFALFGSVAVIGAARRRFKR